MKNVKRILLGLLLAAILFVAIVIIWNWDFIKRFRAMGPGVPYAEASACVADDPDIIVSDSLIYLEAVEEARGKLMSLKEKYGIPGFGVCVAVNGEIVWNEGFGCENYEAGKAVDTRTKFRIGSISKSLTGVALMKLVEDGKLDLEQDLQAYVPNFPTKKHPMKVRQIAGHTSGVRHYKGLEALSNKSYKNAKEGLDIFKDDPLLFEPGTDFSYSTYAYTILETVIESVTQKSYLDFMASEIFPPLDLKSTVPGIKDPGFVAYSSVPGKDKVKKSMEDDLSYKWAGGGFLSTPKDIVTMILNLDSLLTKKTKTLLFTPQEYKNGELTGYSYGFNVGETQESKKTLIHHGGSSRGGRSYLMKIVNDDVIIAICANSDSGVMSSNNYNGAEVFDIASCFF